MSDRRPGHDPWVCAACGVRGEHAHLHASRIAPGVYTCEGCWSETMTLAVTDMQAAVAIWPEPVRGEVQSQALRELELS